MYLLDCFKSLDGQGYLDVRYANHCKVFKWVKQVAIRHVKYVMPPMSKMAPEIFNDASNHKAVVKYCQPNQQSVENIV